MNEGLQNIIGGIFLMSSIFLNIFFNRPLNPFNILFISLGAIIFIYGIFEYRNYQNKAIYLVLTAGIFVCTLILIYILEALKWSTGELIGFYYLFGVIYALGYVGMTYRIFRKSNKLKEV